MTVESTLEFEALEAQAAKVMAQFTAAGYERVAPSLIQPAGLFLDRIGEAIRTRTYIFSDPSGEELCLRPDLTVPVARIFLERGPKTGPAKYCYNGPAFRMQEGLPDRLRPREFRQAGVEFFGEANSDADVEVVALSLNAVRDAGLSNFVLKLGHIGLFTAFLTALPMPERWRKRLHRAFWRPKAFTHLLVALSQKDLPHAQSREAAVEALNNEESLFAHLQAKSIPFIGLRSPQEVITRLQDQAADAREPALVPGIVDLLLKYLQLQGPMLQTLQEMRTLFHSAKIDLDEPLNKAQALFKKLALRAEPAPVLFAADFGRHFEYYTGMVFQIEVEGAGTAGQIVGGGRYDGLIGALSTGACQAAAVGAAIHTERLLAAVRRT